MWLDTGNTTEEQAAFIAARLRDAFSRAERVAMRLLVAKRGAGKVVLAGRMDVLSRPVPLPEPVDLGPVQVVTKSITPSTLGESFIQAACLSHKRLDLGGSIIADSGPNTRWSAYWLGSGRGNDYGDWPCLDLRLALLQDGNQPRLPTPLLTPDSRLFLDVHDLYREVSGIHGYSNHDTRGKELVVVLHDERARLVRVSVQRDGVACRVEGQDLTGLSLTLRAECDGVVDRQVLPALSEQVFPLARPSQKAEVALVQGADLRDHRDPWDIGSVTIEPSGLAALVSQGEGPELEFKPWLEVETGEKRNEVLKTLIAFANGEGGIVVIGINDDGTPAGSAAARKQIKSPCTAASIAGYGGRLRDFVQKNVNHALDLKVEASTLGDELVCVLRVPAGAGGRVYMTAPGNKVFIRKNATTRHPTEEELAGLLKGNPEHVALKGILGRDVLGL